jgi:hypothetical protein
MEGRRDLSHSYCSTGDAAYDVRGNDDFQEGDDLNKNCVHTDGTYRGVRGVFFRKSGNGALYLNRFFVTI